MFSNIANLSKAGSQPSSKFLFYGRSANWISKAKTCIIVILFLSLRGIVAGQCTGSDVFTKITNSSGTVNYPGTNGNANVAVTTTVVGDASRISFCNIVNGFRAGEQDNNGSFKFSFLPAVRGIMINLNALSNTQTAREIVRIRINDVPYSVRVTDIVCSGICFQCSGAVISAANGVITASPDISGNGTGQLIIQAIGEINSIEYLNENQEGNAQGSVFDIFFNNSTCVLPVKLTNFGVEKVNNSVQVNWTSAEEVNVHHYEIERSMNGVDFTAVRNVIAKGSAASYTINDPITRMGKYYYRLKMIDVNGRSEFSKTGEVIFQNQKIQLMPNPASDFITLSGLSGTSTITYYNTFGQLLERVVTGNTTARLNITSYPKGIYILRIVSNGEVVLSEKVIK